MNLAKSKTLSTHLAGDMTLYLYELSDSGKELYSQGKVHPQRFIVRTSCAGIVETFPLRRQALAYINALQEGYNNKHFSNQ